MPKMHRIRRTVLIIFILCAAIPASACGKDEEPPDPHEGMVSVNTGGEVSWITPIEGVPVADFVAEEFSTDGNRVWYEGEAYEASPGIDVSFYQGDIDWAAVKADGVEFAMIRCGYRGSSSGDLFEDEKFRDNIAGATEAGLRVGIYFFSQAKGPREAAEEALYVLDLIEGYEITMPVAFDWEPLADSRTTGITNKELSGAAVTFCDIIRDAGYTPCVYFYRYIAYYQYNLGDLADCIFWVGAPGSSPDFYYDHSIWQYSFTGRIDGIDADVDLNLEFTRIAPPEPSPSPTA